MIGKASFYAPAARLVRTAGGAALLAALALGSNAAMAQDKAAKKDAGKAAAPAQGEQVMWVKLCEKAPLITKDKDGKDVREEKGICLTHHERLDGNTGMVLVSAAIRQVEGQDKQHLMVMVPLGMAIAPGIRASVYNKELWEKAQKNEKVDDAKLSPIKLNFTLCHPAGCTAEIELSKEIMDQMRAGAGLMVFAINANGQVIGFPVPLSGFNVAIDGAAADNKQYTEQRKILMEQIQQRQQAMFEEYKKKQAEGGGQPAATPAAAAPAPAKEKKK